MKKIKLIAISVALCGITACVSKKSDECKIPSKITLSKEVLMDKIKGGWAGQTIGCTYGGPTEFKYNATMIPDSVEIPWNESRVLYYYDSIPGLYDDVYMDLTFVEVFDRLGLNAPLDSFATAFAYADYPLWHANQAARFNIINGIMPPASGHWMNNTHADDIDYQIESDFSGLMSPGMPNMASEISDKIGHIMNYGDGWYGGVYVGAMYSLAFVSDDVEFVVEEALKVIPKESRYYKCMRDVIDWHKHNPNDWKSCWEMCEKKWDIDYGCPDGAFRSFNIDAVINSAYIIIGLLYGDGDFGKTIDISARCGQDSDCNPASAGGILGTMIGYSRLQDYWLNPLKRVEDRNFQYTDISLNRAYELSFDQALQVIELNGGKVSDNEVTIKCQKPEHVRLERAFEGVYPIKRTGFHKPLTEVDSIEFEGTGAVLTGNVKCPSNLDYVAEIEFSVDGNLVKIMKLPVRFKNRSAELFWVYQLEKGPHAITYKWLNPEGDAVVNMGALVTYSDEDIQKKDL